MEISPNKVVAINYTLKNDAGEVIDTSDGREPLTYLHGVGNIIPGLEKELTGKTVGAELDVTIAPKDGYGERNEEMIQEVPRTAFKVEEEIKPGMKFQAQSPEGGVQVLTVTKVSDDSITVDGNHELAGQTLHFDVSVQTIREATPEELEHGHVHGPGGHHH